MDRLSALDASFLYGETPESPMHVAGLAILEPPAVGPDVFAVFRDHLKSRLHLVPFFERKLALTPIQLDHPVWVHDDNLDLDYHFRHVSLPKPETRNAGAAGNAGCAAAHDPARSFTTPLAVLRNRGS